MSHLLTPARRALSLGVEKTSWPEALDPRIRVVIALIYAVLVVAAAQIQTLLLATFVSLAMLLSARLPFYPTLKRIAAMDGFILVMLLLLPFSTPGTPIFVLWGLEASLEGVLKAIEIGLTANAVVMAFLVLVGTQEPVVLGHALHRLGLPEKLVLMLLFTVRYVDVLREEYLRLRRAMKVRGFQSGTNWHSYRSIGYLIGMLLVRATERAERVLGAMKCRGFNGTFPLFHRFALTGRDLVFGLLAGLVCAALIGVEVGSWG